MIIKFALLDNLFDENIVDIKGMGYKKCIKSEARTLLIITKRYSAHGCATF